jgi:hypothetical protein
VLAAGLLLAGCGTDDDPASSAAAASGSSGLTGSHASSSLAGASAGSTTAAACVANSATTYVEAVSAATQGSVVVLTAHPARFLCGGPNNGHYETGGATTSLTLSPSTAIRMLVSGGPQEETVAAADFPGRLAAETVPGIFSVTGPGSMPTAMQEQYQP